ncbi:MAG: hypothetical protein ACRD8Z_07665, partial [Nitrososphaeraceae archaeon]
PMCILNHYHIFFHNWNSSITKHDLLKGWKQVLDYFDKLKYVWKAAFSELYDRAQEIQNIKIVKTGSKITIESDLAVQDFSFRVRTPLYATDEITVEEGENIVTIKQILPEEKIVLYEK